MIPSHSDGSPAPARQDGCPRLTGRFGSLDAFWRLIEPALKHLQPRRICEIGVEKGIFTDRLLAWGQENGCVYVGIDPAPERVAADRIQDPHAAPEGAGTNHLLTARSLDVLPTLDRCDVYFLDGDHNYHTVRHELEWIGRPPTRRAEEAAPVIFAHDVSWPFARRDMYHQPAAIPPEECHPYSENLGVSMETEELIEGGLRAPGQYSIARHAGGPRNGVLTAIEDFLAGESGRGWRAIIVPIAYGLAILYQPDDGALPGGCRDYLNNLRAAVATTGGFFESCEANFLRLYLYAEHAKYHLDEQTRARQLEQGSHYQTLEAYRALEGAYKETCVYNEGLTREYEEMQSAYAALESEYQNLLQHYRALQNHLDHVAPRDTSRQEPGGDPQPGPGTALAGDRAEEMSRPAPPP